MARKPEQRDESWAFLAPSDLREHDLPSQAALGFHRGRTEDLLQRAAATIERLNRDLAEIREARESWKRERDRLEALLEEEKTRAELLVGETMVDAHKASQALRAEAEAEAESVRAEAEALLEPAREEAKRLVAEAREAQAKRSWPRPRRSASGWRRRRSSTSCSPRMCSAARSSSSSAGSRRWALILPRRRRPAKTSGPFAQASEKPRASRSRARRGGKRRLTASRPLPGEAPEPSAVSGIRPQVAADNGDRNLEVAEQASPRLLVEEQPRSNFTDDPMTLLWQNAEDRDTGHQAVEAIRARQKTLRPGQGERPAASRRKRNMMPPDAVEAMRRRTASLRAQRSEDGALVTRCAWCDRIALGEGWVQRETFQNQQTPARQHDRLTHGICPDCFALVKADQARRHLDRGGGRVDREAAGT